MVTSVQGLSPTPISAYEDKQTTLAVNAGNNDIATQSKTLSNVQQHSVPIDANAGKLNSKGDAKETNKSADFSEISSKLHSLLGNDELSVQFSLDKDTKKMIMKVVNSKTKEVVQQFPPEVSLKIARIVTSSLDKGHVTNAKI